MAKYKYALELEDIPNYRYLFIQQLYDSMPEDKKYPVTDFLKIVDEVPVERLAMREHKFTNLMIKALVANGQEKEVFDTEGRAKLVTVRMINLVGKLSNGMKAMQEQLDIMARVTSLTAHTKAMSDFKDAASNINSF